MSDENMGYKTRPFNMAHPLSTRTRHNIKAQNEIGVDSISSLKVSNDVNNAINRKMASFFLYSVVD